VVDVGFESIELLLSVVDNASIFLQFLTHQLTAVFQLVDFFAHHLGFSHLDHQRSIFDSQLSLDSLKLLLGRLSLSAFMRCHPSFLLVSGLNFSQSLQLFSGELELHLQLQRFAEKLISLWR